MGWYPCDGCNYETPPCPSDCSGNIPDLLDVAIASAANDSCSNWSQVNNSAWQISQGSVGGNCAGWTDIILDSDVDPTTPEINTVFPNGCTDVTRTSVSVWLAGDTIWGMVHTRYNFTPPDGLLRRWESHYFSTSVSLPVDCCAWSSQSLTYSHSQRGQAPSWSWFGLEGTQDYGGDLSGATFKITSGTTGCV